jgi:hypothetical protein
VVEYIQQILNGMNSLQKLQQIEYTDHYSVYNKIGNKICDVSCLQDAVMMCSFDSTRYYKQIKIILDQVVNVPFQRMEDDKQLKGQKILPERQEVPFTP